MDHPSKQVARLLAATAALVMLGTVWLAAQEPTPAAPPVACAAPLETLFTEASAACLGKPAGMLCNGAAAPTAEPAGPVANSLAPVGALVEVGVVQSLDAPGFSADGSSGGLLWKRVAATGANILLLGDVTVQDLPIPDFPAWQSSLVQTAAADPECGVAPRSAYVIQNAVSGEPARVVVNGVSLQLRGTAIIQTEGAETVFVTIEGQLQVIAQGQTQGMVAGQQVRVAYNAGDFSVPAAAPAPPLPFEPHRVANFPVALLDRPTILPQPGYVSTQGTVNMRTAPSLNAAIIRQVDTGQIMTVLGRNADGTWYHVRLVNGQTGWMFSELLLHQHGAIEAVYAETPFPPQRFGRLGTTAVVLAPNGAIVRSAPDTAFGVISTIPLGEEVTLMARSPYSPWVKVQRGEIEGWVALIALETQAIVQSLPIDYSVPAPPGPTPIPRGNAFPDPSCYPNCAPP